MEKTLSGRIFGYSDDEPEDDIQTYSTVRAETCQANPNWMQLQFQSQLEVIIKKTEKLDRIAEAIDNIHETSTKVAIGGNAVSAIGGALGLAELGFSSSSSPKTDGVSKAISFFHDAFDIMGMAANFCSVAMETMAISDYEEKANKIVKEIAGVSDSLKEMIYIFQSETDNSENDMQKYIRLGETAGAAFGLGVKISKDVRSYLDAEPSYLKQTLDAEAVGSLGKALKGSSLSKFSNKDKLSKAACLVVSVASDIDQIVKGCTNLSEGTGTELAQRIRCIAKAIRQQINNSRTALGPNAGNYHLKL